MVLLNVKVGTMKHPMLFVVTLSKSSYNLFLSQDWIHGVGAIPSTIHQKLILWIAKGELEVFKADDQPCYINHMHVNFKMYEPEVCSLKVGRDVFDLTNIESCQLGPHGYRLVIKAEGGSAKDSGSP